MRARRLLLGGAAALGLALAALVPAAGPAGAGATARHAPAQASADPVIIVAGTFAGDFVADIYYVPLVARLRADGRSAHIFGLPGSGLADIAQTARALNTFADSVRARTGAARVDLVGHSQGGLVARYYIENLGGAAEVDSNVGLGAPNHGTAVANLAELLGVGNCLGVVSCQQMAIGSSFLAALNAGDDTIGNVRYTNIATIYDAIVVPYSTAFLDNRDGNNTNVTVQWPCVNRTVGHVGLPLDGTVYSAVQDALAHRPITLSCFAL